MNTTSSPCHLLLTCNNVTVPQKDNTSGIATTNHNSPLKKISGSPLRKFSNHSNGTQVSHKMENAGVLGEESRVSVSSVWKRHNLLTPVVWSEQYATHIPMIDRQHEVWACFYICVCGNKQSCVKTTELAL